MTAQAQGIIQANWATTKGVTREIDSLSQQLSLS